MIRSRIKNRSTLANRMKLAREEVRTGGRKLTQGGLAKAVGVDRNTVSRWENGGMLPSDPEMLAALAGALRVDVDWLISGDEDEATPGELHEGTSLKYRAPAELPAGARSLVSGYLDRLRACGCSQAQRRGAEALLLAGARNKVSSTSFGKRSDADVSADVDAAWDVVLRILRREGIRP